MFYFLMIIKNKFLELTFNIPKQTKTKLSRNTDNILYFICDKRYVCTVLSKTEYIKEIE